jgi:hypothetical protein
VATLSVEIGRVVVPPLRVPEPINVEPSKNETVPVGVPPPPDDTVAVKMTFWPNTDGLTEEVKVVVLVWLLTVWVSAAEVLPPTFVSPPYTAVIE